LSILFSLDSAKESEDQQTTHGILGIVEIIREDHGGFRQGYGRYILDLKGRIEYPGTMGWVSLHVLVMMMMMMMMGESSSRVGLYYLA